MTTAPPGGGGKADKTIADGKVVTLPSGALKKRLDDQRERGKREALSELEKKAQAAGYKSIDDLLNSRQPDRTNKGGSGGGGQRAAAPNGGAGGGTEPQPPAGGRSDRRAWARYERDRDAWNKQQNKLLRRVNRLEQRALRAEAAADNKDVEIAMGRVMSQAGVREPDVAIHLLRNEPKGKSEDELNAFDEAKWLEDQKKARPWMFGDAVRVVPATTGTQPGGSQPPKPGDVTPNGKTTETVKSMPGQKFVDLLRSRGLTPPMR